MDTTKQTIHGEVSCRKVNRKAKLSHDMEQADFIHIDVEIFEFSHIRR